VLHGGGVPFIADGLNHCTTAAAGEEETLGMPHMDLNFQSYYKLGVCS
jgi:hypothetical protein